MESGMNAAMPNADQMAGFMEPDDGITLYGRVASTMTLEKAD